MRILKVGTVSNREPFKVDCWNCDSQFEFYSGECEPEDKDDWNPNRMKKVKCPVCGTMIDFNP